MPLRIEPGFEPEKKKQAKHSETKNPDLKKEVLSGKDYAEQIDLDEFPLIMNIREVSEALRISRHMVYRLIENGSLAHIKIGPRCNRIYRESVRKLIDSNSSD